MEILIDLYANHLATLQNHATYILQHNKLDALLIHSGELQAIFLDDQHYPFKINPHFSYWIPEVDAANCWLWIDGVNAPKLWFYAPTDYWHCVEQLPNSFWTNNIEIIPFSNIDKLHELLPAYRDQVAYIGNAPQRALALGIAAEHINSQNILNYIDYHRSFKTDYELTCLREAQKIAVNGHRAAHQAFLAGMSEYHINLAYLAATGQRDTEVPYDNIIALNEHSAILHYTHLAHQPPAESLSFLIDAGASYNGYAADITRTYAAKSDSLFAQLITDLNNEQQSIAKTLRAGVCYSEYHTQMHYRLAALLKRHQLVRDISEEAMVAQGLTCPFFPHGLGHFLGLQVHDVAGFMQDDSGTHLAAPEKYPFLRCTRILQPGMVLTVEPGLYFIESLLAPWRSGDFKQHFAWDLIAQLTRYGGIRIEDNMIIQQDSAENITRALNLS